MGEPTTRVIDFVDAAFEEALALGLAHLEVDAEPLDGRCVSIGGRRTLNLASCSYLGLELDPRLQEGAIEATRRYGTQFSSSRAFLSGPLYAELEALLDEIFDAHTIVMPNTTLVHMAALPVLVGEEDAVVLDHQVHHSVQMAIPQLRLQGTHVQFVRHGCVEQLDEAIRDLSQRHRQVWYMADGVYSMYGDFMPVRALRWLLTRHEQLRLYLDDAHGMSWSGRRGRGYAAESFGEDPRAVIAVSLNKGFGAAGGAIVVRDPALRQKIRNCGGPLIFTGPLQPPVLGAAVASAKLHLTPEIDRFQEELRERIRYANALAAELDLPLVSRDEVPIRYVGLGVKLATFDMARRLLERGIYVNPAAFPAVGPRRSGLRFMVNRHLQLDDLKRTLEAIAELLPEALRAGETDRGEVDRAFRLAPARPRARAAAGGTTLRCQHETRIAALDAAEWDACLGGRGAFDSASLAAFEEVFGDGPPENRWRFHYWIVRDGAGAPVLATFFTEALWKDDLLAAAKVSRAVEERRSDDPYFLTSRSLAMGSLITEGDHLFLDRSGDWRGAMSLLLAAIEDRRDACEAASLVIRDLPGEDAELAGLLEGAGFLHVGLPESLVLDLDWKDEDDFLARLSKRERRFQRERVQPWASAWRTEVICEGSAALDDAGWRHLHGLYRNVQGRNLALNTFPLPETLLPRLARTPGWEILLLRLDSESGDRPGPPRAFAACRAAGPHYTPLLVGMDYRFVESHGLYRQLLARIVERGREVGAERLLFGMGAELEKRRFGARPVRRSMYVQTHDAYHHDVLELIASDLERREPHA